MALRRIVQIVILAVLAIPAWASSEPTEEQLRFIAANVEFTLLHEMGHLLIHELQLGSVRSAEYSHENRQAFAPSASGTSIAHRACT